MSSKSCFTKNKFLRGCCHTQFLRPLSGCFPRGTHPVFVFAVSSKKSSHSHPIKLIFIFCNYQKMKSLPSRAKNAGHKQEQPSGKGSIELPGTFKHMMNPYSKHQLAAPGPSWDTLPDQVHRAPRRQHACRSQEPSQRSGSADLAGRGWWWGRHPSSRGHRQPVEVRWRQDESVWCC